MSEKYKKNRLTGEIRVLTIEESPGQDDEASYL